MTLPSTPIEAHVSTDGPSKVNTRLHGYWLVLARMLWIAIFILTLVVFCANFIVGNYGLIPTTLLVADTSVYFVVGLVLFWRKSTDRFILLMSFNLVVVGGALLQPYPNGLVQWNGVWVFPYVFLLFLAWSSFIVLYMFPDGRFVPGFTRWLALGWIAFWLVTTLPSAFSRLFWWSSPLLTLMHIAYLCSLAFSLLYRYRRASTPVQRQQIKWVVFAMTTVFLVGSVAFLVLYLVPASFPALALSTQLNVLVFLVGICMSVLVPLSIGVALLRYRLWDIDRVINRTLVYALLTAILALIYVGLIIALQSLMRVLTETVAQQPLVIVASTLAIAALFQPLRHHIQRIVDRRFYRSKYDAAKIVAAFSTTLRNEVDLDQLHDQLLAVVQEMMQPAHVSLWLRRPDQDRKRSSEKRSTTDV